MNDRSKGLAAISAAIFIWGFNFVGAKVTLMETDPFALIFLRHAAAVVLFSLIWKLRRKNVVEDVRRHWRRVFPIAMLGIVGNQLFFVWGISLTTPSHSALMYTLLPICTALFARYILKERIPFFRWFGILLGFVGAVMLATENGIDFSGDLLQGDLITFMAVIVFSLFMVFGKPVLMDLGAVRVLVVGYIISAPVMLGITAPAFVAQNWLSLSLLAWGGAFFLVVFATVIAYILHQYALKKLSPALLSAFAYGQPITAAFFSVLLLGEQLSTQFAISSALIFTGLFITERFKGQPLSGRRKVHAGS